MLARGADPWLQDSEGNTAAHLAVLAGAHEAYAALLAWSAQEQQAQKGRRQEEESGREGGSLAFELPAAAPHLLRNAEGLTCVELAAAHGSAATLDAVLNTVREVQWEYGPVRCELYPLAELDSALAMLVAHGRLDVLEGCIRVQMLLKRKWLCFGRERFHWRKRAFLWCFSCFQVAVLLRGTAPGAAVLGVPVSIFRYFLEVTLLLFALTKFKTEARELWEHGIATHFLKSPFFISHDPSLSLSLCLCL